MMTEPPENPFGGKTLIVDAHDGDAYPRPSAALLDAGEQDQVFIRPGIYEDKVFITGRPIHLVGAGRDDVQIFSRRGGPLYLQQVPSGRISGITFRYVGSDQHSAMNLLLLLYCDTVPCHGGYFIRRRDLWPAIAADICRERSLCQPRIGSVCICRRTAEDCRQCVSRQPPFRYCGARSREPSRARQEPVPREYAERDSPLSSRRSAPRRQYV